MAEEAVVPADQAGARPPGELPVLASGASNWGIGLAPDAQIHVVNVNRRDAPDLPKRNLLLQFAVAFSISHSDVSRLVQAGRRGRVTGRRTAPLNQFPQIS